MGINRTLSKPKIFKVPTSATGFETSQVYENIQSVRINKSGKCSIVTNVYASKEVRDADENNCLIQNKIIDFMKDNIMSDKPYKILKSYYQSKGDTVADVLETYNVEIK